MKALARTADWCAAHARLTALVLGVASATGFQPLGLWPVALAAMALQFALVQRAETVGRAALLGWLFGLGHFTLGNSWIAVAFTYQAEMPPVLGWAAVPLLALYLAVYPALACAAAKWIVHDRRGWAMAFAFAGCWIIGEWVRAGAFSGYAWNPFGVILVGPFDRPGLAALAPWFGTYALSGLAVFAAAAAWLLIEERRFLSLALVAALLAIGMYLPAGGETGLGREGTLRFTLVQPDIRQDVLNEPSEYENNLAKTAALTLPRDRGARRLVLWPESGVPDLLRSGYPQRYYDRMTVLGSPEYARARLGRVIGPGSMLLSGTMDLEIAGGNAIAAYNSVTALDANGAIVDSYRKAHLVPYGEYLPMRELLEPLGAARLVPGAIDFWPGPGPRTLVLGPWGKAGVQVCYEIVFSGQVADRRNRPDYIFNPSNDGWFGPSGPPQHLAQARLRAIEEGLPILRSTTTGISAVIDSRGVVRAHLPMHRAGRIDGIIPPAAAPTLFARLGNILPLVWAMIFLGLAAIAMRRRAG
jgi:apolipoprotein N-acyltransferase